MLRMTDIGDAPGPRIDAAPEADWRVEYQGSPACRAAWDQDFGLQRGHMTMSVAVGLPDTALSTQSASEP